MKAVTPQREYLFNLVSQRLDELINGSMPFDIRIIGDVDDSGRFTITLPSHEGNVVRVPVTPPEGGGPSYE
jgi:hypothetical protein